MTDNTGSEGASSGAPEISTGNPRPSFRRRLVCLLPFVEHDDEYEFGKPLTDSIRPAVDGVTVTCRRCGRVTKLDGPWYTYAKEES